MKKVGHRKPSIHILKEDFIKLLKSELSVPNSGKNIDALAKRIFVKASKLQLSTRCLLESTKKQHKTATRIKASPLEDARVFSKYLLLIRRQFNHRGIKQIKEGSKDWLLIKDITQNALDFCETFNLSRNKGFQEYIKLLMGRMKMFTLTRVPSMHESLCNQYIAVHRIQKDNHQGETLAAYLHYDKIINQRTGQGIDYRQIPEKYQFFIDVVDVAKELKMGVKTYIDAQFTAFEWKSAVPEISQMVGIKAKERAVKYLYEKGIPKEDQTPKIDFTKIKDPNANRDKQ